MRQFSSSCQLLRNNKSLASDPFSFSLVEIRSLLTTIPLRTTSCRSRFPYIPGQQLLVLLVDTRCPELVHLVWNRHRLVNDGQFNSAIFASSTDPITLLSEAVIYYVSYFY